MLSAHTWCSQLVFMIDAHTWSLVCSVQHQEKISFQALLEACSASVFVLATCAHWPLPCLCPVLVPGFELRPMRSTCSLGAHLVLIQYSLIAMCLLKSQLLVLTWALDFSPGTLSCSGFCSSKHHYHLYSQILGAVGNKYRQVCTKLRLQQHQMSMCTQVGIPFQWIQNTQVVL